MPWMNPINEMRDKMLTVLSDYVDVRTIIPEQFRAAFESELPLVTFYFGNDDVQENNSQPIIRQHQLNVNIDICRAVDQAEGLDSWLYERSFEVIQAMDNSNYLGFDYIDRLDLKGTTPGDIPLNSDQQVRVLRVRYNILYKTTMTPFSSLDEFLKFKAQYDIDKDQSRFEAEDFVTIREE